MLYRKWSRKREDDGRWSRFVERGRPDEALDLEADVAELKSLFRDEVWGYVILREGESPYRVPAADPWMDLGGEG